MEFPETYGNDTYMEFKDVPLERVLKRNRSYYFEIYVPKGVNVALLDADDEYHYFKRKAGLFKIKYTPNLKGELGIYVQAKGQDSYWGALKYDVK